MQEAGFSADNIAFGSGGGLLQKLNRDTLKFAFKCAAVVVDGQEREVFKNPVTDHGKRSKSGRMKLVKAEGPHGPTLEPSGWTSRATISWSRSFATAGSRRIGRSPKFASGRRRERASPFSFRERISPRPLSPWERLSRCPLALRNIIHQLALAEGW